MSVPSGGAERVRSEPGTFGTGLFVTPVPWHLEERSGGFLRGNRIEDVPGLDIGRTIFPAEEGLDIVPTVSARFPRKAGTGETG